MNTMTTSPDTPEKPKPGRRPGFKQRLTRHIEYTCMTCGNEFPTKDFLRSKQVRYLTIGQPQKVVRARIVGWQCLDCMRQDPDYTREAFDTPGTQPGGGITDEGS